MKYIAFEGTYNEQVWDSETKTIVFIKPQAVVYDVDIQLETGTWKEVKDAIENPN